MVPDRYRDLVRFAAVALVAAGVDLITKGLASLLVSGPTRLLGFPEVGLHLTSIHNQLSAFGLSLGPLTWEINIIVTLPAIVLATLVCRDLSAIDRTAPVSLGLITGAALGNLTSLLASPHGVLDFIAVHVGSTEVVMNVADIAAYVGLAMLLRAGLRVYAALQTKRSVRRASVTNGLVRQHASLDAPPLELVVARPIHREPLPEVGRGQGGPGRREVPAAARDTDEAAPEIQ